MNRMTDYFDYYKSKITLIANTLSIKTPLGWFLIYLPIHTYAFYDLKYIVL